tara:strand:+ start:10446 stop:10685 length:240 start_codon:yes stop_codon:yes gene_type:complete
VGAGSSGERGEDGDEAEMAMAMARMRTETGGMERVMVRRLYAQSRAYGSRYSISMLGRAAGLDARDGVGVVLMDGVDLG